MIFYTPFSPTWLSWTERRKLKSPVSVSIYLFILYNFSFMKCCFYVNWYYYMQFLKHCMESPFILFSLRANYLKTSALKQPLFVSFSILWVSWLIFVCTSSADAAGVSSPSATSWWAEWQLKQPTHHKERVASACCN